VNQPQKINGHLREAVASGKWCLCVFRIDAAGTIYLERHSENFSTPDLERAAALLSGDAMRQPDFDFLAGINVEPSNADSPKVQPDQQAAPRGAATQLPARLGEAFAGEEP
jgi:hypothetical protein